jgi:hypothetical protein
MAALDTTRRTPITSRADRSDERIRLIEEAVLLIRGEWPALACGLCETVNRETGMIIGSPGALDAAIEEAAAEAMRVVDTLYGPDAAAAVRRRAALQEPAPAAAGDGRRRRLIRFRYPAGRRIPATARR